MSSGRIHRYTPGPNRRQRRSKFGKPSSRNRRTTPGRRRQVVYGHRFLFSGHYVAIPVKFITHQQRQRT